MTAAELPAAISVPPTFIAVLLVLISARLTFSVLFSALASAAEISEEMSEES